MIPKEKSNGMKTEQNKSFFYLVFSFTQFSEKLLQKSENKSTRKSYLTKVRKKENELYFLKKK